MSSMIGNHIHMTVFGASHGTAIGCTIDGLPAGVPLDMDALQTFLARRAPGNRTGMEGMTTPRKEADAPVFLSGVYQGRTSGDPLCVMIKNENTRSYDYAPFAVTPRPGHADYTAAVKYGGYADMRGGGHFSGRLTAPLCIAGGICLQALAVLGIRIGAHILSIADVFDTPFDGAVVLPELLTELDAMPFPVLDVQRGQEMQKRIVDAHHDADSVGGTIECVITGLPAGIGDPMFDGMENRLARMLFGIPALRGISFGDRFGDRFGDPENAFPFASVRGSENNDAFCRDAQGVIGTETNHAGGILGGITTGMPLLFTCAFKPTPSIASPQQSVNLQTGEAEKMTIGGRHDPCVVLRAVPCVIAAAAFTVLDALLEKDIVWNPEITKGK